jgi:ornithine racemase
MALKKQERDPNFLRDNNFSFMDYPCLKIHLGKISCNTRIVVKKCLTMGISVAGVTKCVLGDVKIASVMKNSGITVFGDSRIENLERLRKFFGKNQSLIMLRNPMLSEIERLVDICDISLNTGLRTIDKIEEICLKKNLKHSVIVMVETDDEREGLLSEEVSDFCKYVVKNCRAVSLYGLGTNARCISNNGPTPESMRILLDLKKEVKRATGIDLQVISGGNSSSWNLIDGRMVPPGVNQFRIGEAIFLGHETVNYRPIKGAYQDAFVLEAQVIEVKRRNDRIVRIILALGLQDVDRNNICPCNPDLYIISQSSDHTILGIKEPQSSKEINSFLTLETGDIISFKLNYFGLMSCMTSPFVKKKYIEG